MIQPASVFFYIFLATIRSHYSWQIHSYCREKRNDLFYTFSFFCIDCIHHGSIFQSAHTRIHLGLWTKLFYNVLQIRINHSGNKSFPVSENASACSRYGLFRCPYCLSAMRIGFQWPFMLQFICMLKTAYTFFICFEFVFIICVHLCLLKYRISISKTGKNGKSGEFRNWQNDIG